MSYGRAGIFSKVTSGSIFTNQEVQDVKDQAIADTVTPGSDSNLLIVDAAITAAKALSSGLHWSKVDHFSVQKIDGSLAFTKYNYKDVTKHNIIWNGGVSLTTDEGVYGDGSTGYGVIDGLYHGATGANMVRGSSFFGMGHIGEKGCTDNNSEEAIISFNWGGSSNRNLIYHRGNRTGGRYWADLSGARNATIEVFQGNGTLDNAAHWASIIREDTGTIYIYSDGVETMADGVTASSTVPTQPINLLRADDGTKYCLYWGLQFVIAGGGLSNTQVSDLYAAIAAELANIGG